MVGEGQERVGGVKWERQIKYKEEAEPEKDERRSNSRSNPDSLSLINSNKKDQTGREQTWTVNTQRGMRDSPLISPRPRSYVS